MNERLNEHAVLANLSLFSQSMTSFDSSLCLNFRINFFFLLPNVLFNFICLNSSSSQVLFDDFNATKYYFFF